MAYEMVVTRGNIVEASTEAIVNAANNNFWMGGGVAGAIKAAGGAVIEEEAMAKGPVVPGEAVFTSAGRLRYRYVIHAAVMGQDLRTSDKLIRQATVASLTLAENLALKSIAFPAFGTGVGGFPMAACAKIMTIAVNGYRPIARHLETVVFCMFDELGYQAFSKALSELHH